MHNFGYTYNNFPMTISFPQMFRPIPNFNYTDVIAFALKKSLAMYMIAYDQSSLQVFSGTQNVKQDIVLTSLIEIEESPQKNIQKVSIKSQKEQAKTSHDTPPLKKKISKTKERIQIPKKVLASLVQTPQALPIQIQNKNFQHEEDKQSSIILQPQQGQIFQYADIPQFYIPQNQINKRKQQLLLRRVFDWQQIQKIQKQKPKQKRQLKRLN